MAKFHFAGSRTSSVWGFCFFLLLSLAVGCSDTTDPVVSPDDLSFTYTPESAVVTMTLGDGTSFSIICTPDVPLQWSWSLNGMPVGQEQVYDYQSTHVGVDTLRVEYSFQSVSWNRTWYADIEQNESTAPNNIPWVNLGHGPQAADVVVSWHQIPAGVYPLSEYEVVFSYDGAITEENLSSATSLAVVPFDEELVAYSVTFSAVEHGMIAGAEAWFTVRGKDELGQWSAIPTSSQNHVISSPWMLEGYVYSESLEPIADLIIDYGCPSCRVNTDATGFFSIGPLPNVDTFDLQTMSDDSWYDFIARDVAYDPDGNYDLMVLSKDEIDANCSTYDSDFLTFLKKMTKTEQVTPYRPNHNLYKWEHFPVSVYIPEFTNELQLDYGALCDEVVEFWNIAMDADYLVQVDSPDEADIEIYFGYESPLYAGRTILSEPNDINYSLGDVIPEKILVHVRDDLNQEIDVQVVAMHELGHALGAYNHASCNGSEFLMRNVPTGALDGGPENAIHPDERRMFRAIRYLPQGTNMADFQ